MFLLQDGPTCAGVVCFGPWNAEATVIRSESKAFHAKPVGGTPSRVRVYHFCAPPTVWRMLVLEDLGGFKDQPPRSMSAGEPLNRRNHHSCEKSMGTYHS